MDRVRTSLLAFCLCTVSPLTAWANDLEGHIESVNAGEQSFVVQGITFHVTERTDYDDGLRTFEDLAVGQRVEVDFEYREGRHYALEIELED